MTETHLQGTPVPVPRGGGAIVDGDGFRLGTPALVCRWRLSNGRLPLQNRLLRALHIRRVNGSLVTAEFVAWVKQQLEWGLEKGAAQDPDGVLLLVVDEEGRAAISVGPYRPLKGTSLGSLARRAVGAVQEAEETGVAPECIWVVRDGSLVCGVEEGCHASGAATLIGDLAQTLGIPWSREGHLAVDLVNHPSQVDFDEAFLVSDEHGVVPASNARGPLSIRMFEGYARLLERQGSHRKR